LGSEITVDLLALGPPPAKPVQYRISGPDIDNLRHYARDLAGVVMQDNTRDISYDWMEPARVIRAKILANQAQKFGITPVDIATALNSVSVGNSVTAIRDDIYLIDIIARSQEDERGSIKTLKCLKIPVSDGRSIPLESVAVFSYELEQPVIWRPSRVPTITVEANVLDGVH